LSTGYEPIQITATPRREGRINPAAIDVLRQLGNDGMRSQRGRGRLYEASDRRQQRAIANHVQGAVAAEIASLFPETVVNANVSVMELSRRDSPKWHMRLAFDHVNCLPKTLFLLLFCALYFLHPRWGFA
jgi:hypothetical protein